MEGYVNLFDNEHEGTNRPHFKGYLKIDGIDHEFALWPNKDGKKGYSGKYKPKQPRENPSDVTQADADRAWEVAKQTMKPKQENESTGTQATDLDDEIPF